MSNNYFLNEIEIAKKENRFFDLSQEDTSTGIEISLNHVYYLHRLLDTTYNEDGDIIDNRIDWVNMNNARGGRLFTSLDPYYDYDRILDDDTLFRFSSITNGHHVEHILVPIENLTTFSDYCISHNETLIGIMNMAAIEKYYNEYIKVNDANDMIIDYRLNRKSFNKIHMDDIRRIHHLTSGYFRLFMNLRKLQFFKMKLDANGDLLRVIFSFLYGNHYGNDIKSAIFERMGYHNLKKRVRHIEFLVSEFDHKH